MPGSAHDKNIREFTIDSGGRHIGLPFRNITGIISGHPTSTSAHEVDRIGDLFGGGENL